MAPKSTQQQVRSTEKYTKANDGDIRFFVCLLVIVITFNQLPQTQGKRYPPKHNQIERVYNKTHSDLWDCSGVVCPKSHGLSVECGTSVSIDVEIECEQCIPGKTYSSSDGYHICKPCRSCNKNQESSGKCTIEEDSTKCGKCMTGHYKASTGNCVECSWCCNGTKDHDHMSDCEGMAANKQCRRQMHDEECAPTSEPSSQYNGSVVLGLALGITGSVVLVIIISIASYKGRYMIKQKISQLWSFFCHRAAATSSSRGCNGPQSVDCAENLIISGINDSVLGRPPPSSENVEENISDIPEGEQKSGDDHQLSESSVDTPFVKLQFEDELVSTSDRLRKKELQMSTEPEESPRSKRRDLLAERVLNLPLRCQRRIWALLNDMSEQVADCRDLAEIIGLEAWEVKSLKQSKNATDAVLQKFNSSTDGTVRTFVGHLETIGRQDVIDVIYDWMNEKNAISK